MGVLKPNKVTLHFLSVFCFLLFCFLCFILNHVWLVFLSLFDCSFVRPPVRPFASVSFSLRSLLWQTVTTNESQLEQINYP